MRERQFVRCPSCGSNFSVPTVILSADVAATVYCSFCGEEVQVTAPLPEPSQDLPAWMEDEWGSEDYVRA